MNAAWYSETRPRRDLNPRMPSVPGRRLRPLAYEATVPGMLTTPLGRFSLLQPLQGLDDLFPVEADDPRRHAHGRDASQLRVFQDGVFLEAQAVGNGLGVQQFSRHRNPLSRFAAWLGPAIP